MRSLLGGLRSALLSARSRSTSNDRSRSKKTSFEALEKRCLLAGDVLASIAGGVYDDQTGNGLSPDDIAIGNVVLDLYRDGGDGAFDGIVPGSDDTQVGTTTSAADGSYRFSNLSAGTYFVRQQPAPGFVNAGSAAVRTVVITAADLTGVAFTPVDTFVTQQHVEASSLGVASEEHSVFAPEALGGERDLYVELTSAFGELQLSVNAFGAPMFQYDTSAATTGLRLVTWDGFDNDGDVLNPTGIKDSSGTHGIDLTESGAVEGVRFLSGADHDGGTLTLRIYSDANNWSYANIAVPNTGSAGTSPFVLHFSDLVAGGVGGVDLTNVGAIQMEIDGAIAVDGQITRIDTFGPKVLDANFLNSQPTDLVIDKTDDPDPVVAGEQLTYTLTITNDSLLTATGVVVVDQLPGEVTFVSSSSTQGGTSHAGGLVTANLGTMAPGTVATVSMLVDVHSDAPATLFNTATVSGNEIEVTLANNTDNEVTEVVRVWDLEIDKSDDPDPVIAGDNLTYTLLVTNNGPSDAADVKVEDTLPPEVTYISSTTTQGSVSHAGGSVTADLGDLPAGSSATITILTQVSDSASGQIDNTSMVGGRPIQPGQSPNETRTDNNRADEPTLIVAPDSSISGFVYVDADDDGIFDPAEQPLPNVLVLLTGFDFRGVPVSRQDHTGSDGSYSFTGLLPGSYSVEEVQPPPPIIDGKDTPGQVLGGASLLTFSIADDLFSNIGLAGSVDVIDFNFGELMHTTSKRDWMF